MDTRVEGVTLWAGFISDILIHYEEHRAGFAKPLFDMVENVDLSDPTRPVPMTLYNDLCRWVEQRVGPSNTKKLGIAIGNRAYGEMMRRGSFGDKITPLDILTELKKIASVMIQDPHERGWEIVSTQMREIIMRRTQTFNCLLQEGLLRSLVERTGVKAPSIVHESCTRKGHDFCEYRVTWAVE